MERRKKRGNWEWLRLFGGRVRVGFKETREGRRSVALCVEISKGRSPEAKEPVDNAITRNASRLMPIVDAVESIGKSDTVSLLEKGGAGNP